MTSGTGGTADAGATGGWYTGAGSFRLGIAMGGTEKVGGVTDRAGAAGLGDGAGTVGCGSG